MGRIGADQPWLAGRWLGEQVAADVPRRQAPRAQAGEHQVGEVLAHATTALEHFHQRRGDLGGFGIERELAENLLHQRLHTQQQWLAGRKTAFGKLDEGFFQVHVG